MDDALVYKIFLVPLGTDCSSEYIFNNPKQLPDDTTIPNSFHSLFSDTNLHPSTITMKFSALLLTVVAAVASAAPQNSGTVGNGNKLVGTTPALFEG